MKKFFSATLLMLVMGVCTAQDNPVKLVGKVKHLKGDRYELIIEAKIAPDWSIYSQKNPEEGAYPTKISFANTNDIVLIGNPKEVSNHKKIINDDIYNVKLVKYYNSVLFKQIVRKKNKKLKKIKVAVDFMSCSSGSCLPPTEQSLFFTL